MKKTIILLLFLYLSISSLHAAAWQRDHFNNGVNLLVQEDHSAPVAMIQIWLKVGGRDELPSKTGLAHVFEHMMFKGSKHLKAGEFSKTIAAMGGSDNAFTSTDFTAYFETIPAQEIKKVIKMEAERFSQLNLKKADFLKEIEVIKEERRMRTEDNPGGRLYEELMAASLRLHPYRNPVIGWMQDLESLNIEDVHAFYKKHYVPSNVTVVIVGDVQFKDVQKWTKKSFGRIKSKHTAPARFTPTEPKALGAKRIEIHVPAKLAAVDITIQVPVWVPHQNDQQAAALAIATEIIGGGKGALMHRALVDQQQVASGLGIYHDPFGMGLDLWYVSAQLSQKQQPDAFQKAFWKTLKDMSNQITDAYVAAAKKRMISSEIFAQDSLYLRAKKAGMMETVGIGANNMDYWLDLLRQVDTKQVSAVMQQFLVQEHSTTGVLYPTEAKQ
ncbi:MAG: pitrilysin family protein [Mariprofundaceae bacterium]|nr:pitrilysin family protein [Mariprofundaceae bacterium]